MNQEEIPDLREKGWQTDTDNEARREVVWAMDVIDHVDMGHLVLEQIHSKLATADKDTEKLLNDPEYMLDSLSDDDCMYIQSEIVSVAQAIEDNVMVDDLLKMVGY